MSDPRLERMARTIVAYCLALKAGDLLRIEAPALAQPLVNRVYAEALKAGAHVATQISLDGLQETFYRHASEEQLRFVSESERVSVETISARLVIGGSWNTRGLAGVEPNKIALQHRARSELSKRLLERKAQGQLRSCITQFPTQADAQQAEMALDEYEAFVFGACSRTARTRLPSGRVCRGRRLK